MAANSNTDGAAAGARGLTTDAASQGVEGRPLTPYRIDLRTKCLVSKDGQWVEDADDKWVYLATDMDAREQEYRDLLAHVITARDTYAAQLAAADAAREALRVENERLKADLRKLKDAIAPHWETPEDEYLFETLQNFVDEARNTREVAGEAEDLRRQLLDAQADLEIAADYEARIEAEAQALMQARAEAAPAWKCFHCGMVIRDEQHAREHFGAAAGSGTFCAERAALVHERDDAILQLSRVALECQRAGWSGTVDTSVAERVKQCLASITMNINRDNGRYSEQPRVYPVQTLLEAFADGVPVAAERAAEAASRDEDRPMTVEEQLRAEVARLRAQLKETQKKRDETLVAKQYEDEKLELEWSDRRGHYHPTEFYKAVLYCTLDHSYDTTGDGVPYGMPPVYVDAFAPVVAKHRLLIEPDWKRTTLHPTDEQKASFEAELLDAQNKVRAALSGEEPGR